MPKHHLKDSLMYIFSGAQNPKQLLKSKHKYHVNKFNIRDNKNQTIT